MKTGDTISSIGEERDDPIYNESICFIIRSWKRQKSGKNETRHLRARVSLLIDIKLKEKSCKLKADDKGIEGVGKMVPKPRTQDCDPSVKVTVEVEGCD